MRLPALVAAVALAATAVLADSRLATADRVVQLTRSTAWTLVESVPVSFRTFHPQGMVKIGDTLWVSSVDRAGTGHLFKMDRGGRLLASRTIGDRLRYHPGGLDYDGRDLWVAVAEYRPDSTAIVYRVDPDTLDATEVLRVDDHLGAVAFDTDDRVLHGVSWGSRRFYQWPIDRDGRASGAVAARPPARQNPSHYVDYQDCKYAGRHRMLCTGVSEIRQTAGTSLRLGGVDLIDLRDGRPLHQAPVLLWSPAGVAMTQNPVWLEAHGETLRLYALPDDDRSTLYVYEARAPR